MPCKNHPLAEENLNKCERCRQSFCPDCVVELKGQFYCADCKGEAVKDMQSGVGTDGLELAGLGARFAAAFIDGLLMLIPGLLLMAVLGVGVLGMGAAGAGALGVGVATIIYLVVVLGISVAYEGLMLSSRGQTLGKMAIKIKVVTPEGHDISTGQAWGRAGVRLLFNIVGNIPFMQWAYLVDILFIFGAERTCLHDKVAKTRVVKWER